jgi:adenylate kinase
MLGGKSLDKVVVLSADIEEVVARLLNRAKEQGRADDSDEVIRRRLEVYAEQTAPLISLYASRGILVEVNGIGTIAEVNDRLMKAISAL